MAEAAANALRGAPEWTPWGRPRLGERGPETAFHHALVLARARGSEAIRVIAPGDLIVGGDPAQFEWSPMPWALRGRRQWLAPGGVASGTVFQGLGDRLFGFGDSVCEQLFEGRGFGERSLEGWLTALERRVAYCEQRGIIYRHLVMPESHAIYPDAIPGAPKLSPQRPIAQILARAGESLRATIVYPLEAMIAGRAKAETAHPHDVHCTGYGCFLCYRALMATLTAIGPAEILREDQLLSRNFLLAGDLARAVGAPPRRVDQLVAPPVKHRAIIHGASYKANQVDVIECEAAPPRRLVMFRTSNSTLLFPYLMRHFSRIAAVASVHACFDLIESERPDVVIAEMPERYFAPHHSAASEVDRGMRLVDSEHDFEARTGHKLPLPREG